MDPARLKTMLDQYSQGCGAPESLAFRYRHATFAVLAEILATLKEGTKTVTTTTTEPEAPTVPVVAPAKP
jgi:hypothetical protein